MAWKNLKQRSLADSMIVAHNAIKAGIYALARIVRTFSGVINVYIPNGFEVATLRRESEPTGA